MQGYQHDICGQEVLIRNAQTYCEQKWLTRNNMFTLTRNTMFN